MVFINNQDQEQNIQQNQEQNKSQENNQKSDKDKEKPQNRQEEKHQNMHNFLTGAVSNYIGQYLGIILSNILFTHQHEIDIGSAGFISATIAGGFSGILIGKAKGPYERFAAIVFAVGLNRILFDIIDKAMGGEGIESDSIIASLVVDSIIIFYLVLTLEALYRLFTQKDLSHPTRKVAFTGIIISAAINLYYHYKEEIQLQTNQTNTDTNNTDTNQTNNNTDNQ